MFLSSKFSSYLDDDPQTTRCVYSSQMGLDSLDLVVEETRTSLKPPAAWLLLPDFLEGAIAVEKSQG